MFLKRPTSIYNLKEKTDSELIQIIGNNKPGTDFHADAVSEREYRQWWRDFWLRGLVAWFALGLSIISILISLKIIKPLG